MTSTPLGRRCLAAVILVLCAAGYVASRVPLLPVGFGSDADTWTLAANAAAFVSRGEYRPSRLPGHPLHEWLHSLLIVFGGPLLSNSFTLALSAALVLVSERLGRSLGVDRSWTAAAAIAVHPLFWITSADSTDFMMAALLGNSALLVAVKQAPVWAGLLLALATATRIETLVFALPMASVLAPGIRLRSLVPACALSLAFYLPGLLRLPHTPGPLGDLVTSRHSIPLRLDIFAVHLWGACGLVPSLAALGTLLRCREQLKQAVRQRQPLTVCALFLGSVYLLITLVHPGKLTYYMPIVPIVSLALVQLAPARWGALLIGAFCSYAFVYPDVIDRDQTGLHPTFRWNNGLVVKDWIARWNMAHAARRIELNRPRGDGVLVLGSWLPAWRFGNQHALPTSVLEDLIPVDPRDNEGFETTDGMSVVHKLDFAAAAALRAADVPLLYAEGIDSFLLQTYAYDVAALAAQPVSVRELAGSVAERFSLHHLVACGFETDRFVECVHSRSASVATANHAAGADP